MNQLSDVDLPDGWMQQILGLGPDKLALVLGHLANEGQVTDAQFKKARTGLAPPFSSAKWEDVARDFPGSPHDISLMQQSTFKVDTVLLPPSFHENIAEMAWRILDVYQERIAQDREEARVRVFDAYLIPIVGLFQGRIVDKPEHAMTGTEYSTGGQVEHELFMIGGILFFVIEMKPQSEGKDNIAQLFLELLSAAAINKTANFEHLRVHGLLTDLQDYYFYSYDPTQRKFDHDETFLVNPQREYFISDMLSVTNKVFSVILHAYTEGLGATANASRRKPSALPGGSSPAQQILGKFTDNTVSTSGSQSHSGPRKSTEYWDTALQSALQCLAKFREPVNSLDHNETQSREAIGLLTESVRSIPRFSRYSGEQDPSTVGELKTMTRGLVRTKCTKLVDQRM